MRNHPDTHLLSVASGPHLDPGVGSMHSIHSYIEHSQWKFIFLPSCGCVHVGLNVLMVQYGLPKSSLGHQQLSLGRLKAAHTHFQFDLTVLMLQCICFCYDRVHLSKAPQQCGGWRGYLTPWGRKGHFLYGLCHVSFLYYYWLSQRRLRKSLQYRMCRRTARQRLEYGTCS